MDSAHLGILILDACVCVLVLAEYCQNINCTIKVKTFWLVPTTSKDCLRVRMWF